jgi:hypothetical protein
VQVLADWHNVLATTIARATAVVEDASNKRATIRIKSLKVRALLLSCRR